MKYPPNESDTSHDSYVLVAPEYDVELMAKNEHEAKNKSTDFHQLNKELGGDDLPNLQHRTLTDYFIDCTTPLMIFLMMMAVVSFLLDVRYIFSEVEHVYIRIVAFFLVMGVVALNRVIARDGAEDSLIYIFGLAGVTALFTLATSNWYVGSIARGFKNGPYSAVILNTSVVMIVWWLTNRLTHECCVDENETAGDMGILTGTLRNFQKFSKKQPQPKSYQKKTLSEKFLVPKKSNETRCDTETVVAFDPSEWEDPNKQIVEDKVFIEASKRLSKRNPGISIFYFAAVAMIVFALGLPVMRAGGEVYELRGHFFVAIYTTSAMFLLLLTSLGGLRQYFRSRDVYFPAMIGVFWFGLGSVMVFAVLLGAMRLPTPLMPPIANIEYHEKGFFEKESTFTFTNSVARSVKDSGVLDTIGNGVLVVFSLFFFYGLVRAFGGFAAWVGRHRLYFPNWVIALFAKIDRFLERIVHMPSFPKGKQIIRIRKELSQSIHFASNMRGEGVAERDQTTQYIAHAYDALCALAYDMGCPKKDNQTPYEFIQSFPKEMKNIKKDALLLTELYVRAAYSQLELDKGVLDSIRKFWITYESVRGRHVR